MKSGGSVSGIFFVILKCAGDAGKATKKARAFFIIYRVLVCAQRPVRRETYADNGSARALQHTRTLRLQRGHVATCRVAQEEEVCDDKPF